MEIEDMLFRLGLSSKTQNIVVDLDGTGEQKLGGDLQTDIGLIYGIALYADGVTPTNDPLITTTDAMNLWLNIKMGGQDAIEVIRMDDLLNVYAGSPVIRKKKYTPLIIPYQDISLTKSSIFNPLKIGSNSETTAVVWMNMYYISMDALQYLVNLGPDYGRATDETIQPILDMVKAATEGAQQNMPTVAANPNAKPRKK